MRKPAPRTSRSAFRVLHSALALALMAAAATAGAATYYASPSGAADAACTADDPGTIQAAVNKAANGTSWEAGDEVVLLPGTYDFSSASGAALSGLSGNSCVTVAKKYLTIRSANGDPASAIIRGQGVTQIISEDLTATNWPASCRAIGANVPVRLEGVTITNFYATMDGTALASKNANELRAQNCIIACNLGRNGAAALRVAASDCLFLCNTNAAGPGGAMNAGSAIGCTFRLNYGANGGAVTGAGRIAGCLFEANNGSNGGGIYNSRPILDCFFTNNIARGEGGAVYGAQYPGSAVHICSNCVFIGNTAASGGGAMRYESAAHCTFIENKSTSGEGGALVTDDRTIYERGLIYHDSSAIAYFGNQLDGISEAQFCGTEFRVSEFTGAIMREQLKKLDPILADLRRNKRYLMDKLGDIYGFIKSNDIDGDCGTTLPFFFDTEKEALAFKAKADEAGIGGTRPIDTGKHVYSNWTPIMEKRGAFNPKFDPFKFEENQGLQTDYSADMCKKTLDLLSRAVYVGVNPDLDESGLDVMAAKLR